MCLAYIHQAYAFELDQHIVKQVAERFGQKASARLLYWQNIVENAKDKPAHEQLEIANSFFNKVRFLSDQEHWQKEDYWATPLEMLATNGGDCEDYSIAKYFTLLELGIPDEKMRITMVKAVQLNQYHMVLAYYETPSAMPLILDNLDGNIKPASERNDLIPIYSFNASQLWLNKEKGRGILSGNSSQLKLWQNLRQRINSAKLKQPKLKTEF